MNETEKEKTINIIKVRDDREPIHFQMNGDKTGFELIGKIDLDWCSDSQFTKADLRARVEPWLTSLFQSEHLSLLVGSGLSSAIKFAACGSSDNGMGGNICFSEFSDEINAAAKESAVRTGRISPNGNANIEDQIRVTNELIRGLSILKGKDEIFPGIDDKLETLTTELEQALES